MRLTGNAETVGSAVIEQALDDDILEDDLALLIVRRHGQA